jgi:hypothetical protein
VKLSPEEVAKFEALLARGEVVFSVQAGETDAKPVSYGELIRQRRKMAELLSRLVLATVTLMLLLGVWRQWVRLGRRGLLLDHLAVLPQWRFFGQSEIAWRKDSFDDYHLLARLGTVGGAAGPWQELLWNAERRWLDAVWNGQPRSMMVIQEHAERLCRTPDNGAAPYIQTSLAYLVVLRHCLDACPPKQGTAMQFALVATRGRGERLLEARFISAWHTN